MEYLEGKSYLFLKNKNEKLKISKELPLNNGTILVVKGSRDLFPY